MISVLILDINEAKENETKKRRTGIPACSFFVKDCTLWEQTLLRRG